MNSDWLVDAIHLLDWTKTVIAVNREGNKVKIGAMMRLNQYLF